MLPVASEAEQGVWLAVIAARARLAVRREVQRYVDSWGWGPGVYELIGVSAERVAEEFAGVGQRWLGAGITVISYGSASYPERLRGIEDPPLVLFSRGAALDQLAGKPSVAIVGSRGASMRSTTVAHQLAAELSTRGVAVISGLAAGVDAAAHRGALQTVTGAVSTVAVFGCGVNHVYPAMHRSLAAQVLASGGVLLSQFEPDARPLPANFLNRNRVIAALADVTIVIEASERSGSLTTARAAAEYGREVLVFPGAWYDPAFAGSNHLVQQGAHLVTSVGQVLEFCGFAEESAAPVQPTTQKTTTLSPHAQAILDLVPKVGDAHEEALLQNCADIPATRAALMTLELEGIIERRVGNRYVRVG